MQECEIELVVANSAFQSEFDNIMIKYCLCAILLQVIAKHTIYLDTLHVRQEHILNDSNETLLHKQELQNNYNYQYVGTVQVLQDKLVNFKVIFDTGSNAIWLPHEQCVTCLSTNGLRSNSTNGVQIRYTMGQITGVTDQVIMSVDNRFSSTDVILATQTEGMAGACYEGIIGLSEETNHSFIEWPISFYYTFGGSRMSSITFGGYDESYQLTYISTRGQWFIECQFLDNSYNALIDSGTSLLVMPSNALQVLQQQLSNCEFQEIIRCPCPTHDISQFPTLEFQLVNHTFTLEPRFYVQVNQNDPVCNVLISSIASDLVILGNPFMRKYYTVFDKHNSRIGIAENEIHITPAHSNHGLVLIACFAIAMAIIKAINTIIDYQLSITNKLLV